MIRASAVRSLACVALAAAALAACSSNAGFGGAPPYQGGQPNATPYPQGATPYDNGSPQATPTPETPLTVDSANARLAYDAYAADPVKAPRLVEVTFALNNPAASPMPVSDIAIAADSAKPTHVPLSLQALPDQDTVETLVAIAPPKDYSKTKQLALTFSDSKGTLLAQETVDFPTSSDATLTPLDKKQPAGGLTVDDVSISNVTAPGGGLHYDLTFSATNAGTSDVSIAYFTVSTPKTDKLDSQTVKIAVPVKVAARTEMSPISVVVPYTEKAKALPAGKYVVTAYDSKDTSLAQASGPLL